jgi:hypothetical protein
MAKKKISGLPAGSALNGTELVPIVQAGTTKRTTTQAIADLGNASSVSGSGTINYLAKFTASSTLGDSTLVNDASGQLGLGVVPSPWSSTLIKAFQIGNLGGSISSYTALNTSTPYMFVDNNAYFDGTSDKYIVNNRGAARYMQANNSHSWFIAPTGTTGSAISFVEAMTLSAGGNLSLGVTLSAWDVSFKAMQIGIGTSLYNNTSSNGTFLGSNLYYNGTDNKYIANGTANAYGQTQGEHKWFTAPSGTAGNTITFAQVMTLTTSGNLLIGTTTDTSGYKLQIKGLGRVIGDNNVLNFGELDTNNIYFQALDLAGSTAKGIVFFGTSEYMRIVSSGNVLINTSTDVASSKLTINSTTQGVLVPRMTETQINNINLPATGLLAYNTTINHMCMFDGSVWKKLSMSNM